MMVWRSDTVMTFHTTAVEDEMALTVQKTQNDEVSPEISDEVAMVKMAANSDPP